MKGNIARASVSVVVPCYCCAESIRRAVDSVLNQSMLPQELILVDDASEDGGATLNAINAIKSAYSSDIHIEVIIQERNGGPAGARNRGWDAATQTYIAFLDADDAWLSDKIYIQYGFMLSNRHIDLCGHLIARKDQYKFEGMHQSGGVDYTMISKSSLLLRNCFPTSSVMLKRSISLRFDPDQAYCEDYALWLLFRHLGFSVARIDNTLGCAYKAAYGDSGLSAQMWGMELGELHCFKELYRRNLLGGVALCVVSLSSLVKFCRRLMILVMCRKWMA